MAGIKIHQYPLERTSFGDEDFYDIDYWDGTGYQSAKVKGSVLKSALGYSFIDIQNNTGGYTLAPTDAGKVITNGGNPFRDLLINTSLNAPGHTFHIKGRVVVSPQLGVNIDLPNGTTITSPDTFICVADTHYILHRKAYTGTNWVLSAINSETLSNLGSKDLAQLDLIREYEVFEDGTLKFVTNDAGNDAKLQIGENSSERFGEIELNSETFNQTVAIQDEENNGIGMIIRVNPNEFDIDSRSDISNPATRRNRLYFTPDNTFLEHFEGGQLRLGESSITGGNRFTDYNEVKKGLMYYADYSADFVDRSLVDKAYVDASSKNIANTNLSIPPATNRTVTIPSDSLVDFGANARFRNNILELQSVTRGFLMNRVTTIQMNGIVGMADNELVFNTDLKAIFRYDATLLQWVALSSGYGIIAVYSGSGSGVPTFFATLQSALETCKASGGYFTVKLYSNITITSAIEIDYTGSGVGKSYLFRQLTIDFNGFSVTNAEANTSEGFDIRLSNTSSVYQEVRLINGNIIRTNGTGTHHALKCDQTARFGTIQMGKMLIYCQNSFASKINLGLSTNIDASKICDLGGSTFISATGTALQVESPNLITKFFNALNNNANFTFIASDGSYENFYVENLGSGVVFRPIGSNFKYAKNFTVRTNSGRGIDPSIGNLNAVISDFQVYSTSGVAMFIHSECTITNFYARTGNARCLDYAGLAEISNGDLENNSSTSQTVYAFNFTKIVNLNAINRGANLGMEAYNGTSTRRGEIINCNFTSASSIGGHIQASGSTSYVHAHNCTFRSLLNTSGGHALFLTQISSGVIQITNSKFIVQNSGANCLTTGGTPNVKSFGNTHNEVASTPINANVTLSTLANF